jgi:hypothetical protein
MSTAGITSSTSGIAYATAIAYTAAITDPTVVAIVSTATIEPAAIESATPVAAIPRPGADKDATYEPARSVIAVGRASVGIIRIVAVRTDWGRIPVAVVSVPSPVTNPNPHTYLGVSRSRHQRCGNHQRTEQQEIS